IVVTLNTLQVTPYVLTIISIGIIVLILLFMFLGLKDFIPNAIAGIIVHKKEFVTDGAWIRVGTVQGEVVHVDLIETRLKTINGDVVYVPNTQLINEKV